jgi:hypothetical protein
MGKTDFIAKIEEIERNEIRLWYKKSNSGS